MQDKPINNQTHLIAAPLLPLFSHQTHVGKLESLTMEYFIKPRLATRWWEMSETMDGIHNGRKQCTGRGERIMWTALIFPLGFDEVAHDLEHGREQIEKDRPTLLRLTSPILLCGKLLESPLDNPDSTQLHTVTQLHWKARTSRGCCDTDEAKRKKFGNRLTGPQLGAENSKP